MAEIRLQRRLKNMKPEEVASVSRRLSRNVSGSVQDVPAEENVQDILQYYASIDPGSFCNLIGYKAVRALRKLSGKGKRLPGGLFLEFSQTVYQHDVILDLISLGVAERMEEDGKPGYFVDDLVFRMVRFIPKDELDIMEEVEQIYELAHRHLLFWGIVREEVLISILRSYLPNNTYDMVQQMTYQVLLYRCGTDVMVRDEEQGPFLIPREAIGNPEVTALLRSCLWSALDYRVPSQDELNAMYLFPNHLSEDEFRYLAWACPEAGLPGSMEACKKDPGKMMQEALENSEHMRSCFYTLDRARRMVQQGHFREAVLELLMFFPENDRKPFGAKRIRLCQRVADSVGSWALKGWSWKELKEEPFLASGPYRQMELSELFSGLEIPNFYDMCPCGSGKLYGFCHGRGN